MLTITNVKVYGLEESIIASGYPFRTDLPSDMKNMLSIVNEHNIDYPDEVSDFKRAVKLGNTPIGSGHSNWTKGVIVQFDLTYSAAFTQQFQRYKFFDIISSQSKMHMIHKMDFDECFNECVTDEIKSILKRYQEEYNSNPSRTNFYKLLYNCPLGIMLTMRVSSNYMNLRNVWCQRHNHKLDEWKEFCRFIQEELPYFKELCLAKEKE